MEILVIRQRLNLRSTAKNYEDITFKVHITLTDRITVTTKEGTEPAIEGSNDRRFDFTFSKSK